MSFLTICLNPTIQKTLRFPSITPNAVNRTAVHRLDASGKGINVSRVLTQLGKKAVHLTQLGGEMKPLFLSLCEQDGLSVEWAESHSAIRFCYTIINDSDNSVTELIESSQPVSPDTEHLLLNKFNNLLSPPRLSSYNCCDSSMARGSSSLIISGTKAAGFSDAVIPEMVRRAKEKGLFVILDIKGGDLLESLKYEPDVIKPNYEEFTETFKTEPTKDMLVEIAQKHRCRIILTNGSRKILAADGSNYLEIEVPGIDRAVNTTGCGDAFTAGLAAALEDGVSFGAAINEGIRCGALNAEFLKPGVIR